MKNEHQDDAGKSPGPGEFWREIDENLVRKPKGTWHRPEESRISWQMFVRMTPGPTQACHVLTRLWSAKSRDHKDSNSKVDLAIDQFKMSLVDVL